MVACAVVVAVSTLTAAPCLALVTQSESVPREEPASAPNAAVAGGEIDDVDEKQSVVDVDVFPPRVRTLSVVWVPLVGYGSLNGWGLGAEGLWPFGLDGSGRSPLSDAKASGYWTFEGNMRLRAETNLYWGQGKYYSRAKFEFSDLSRRYWGIGPDTPASAEETWQPRDLQVYGEFFRRLGGRQFKIGVRVEYNNLVMVERDPGGALVTEPVVGADGGAAAGWGVLADWDRRDRRFHPRRGLYHQAFVLFFADDFGGDHGFTLYNLDLRHYFPVGSRGNVLAGQLFWYSAQGNTPFWRLAALGGRVHSRGYRRGRYLDDHLVAGQAEIRLGVMRDLGLVGFAGLAAVADRLSALRADTVRPTVGLGLRYFARDGDDVIPVHLDVAYGERFEFYLGVGDAF